MSRTSTYRTSAQIKLGLPKIQKVVSHTQRCTDLEPNAIVTWIARRVYEDEKGEVIFRNLEEECQRRMPACKKSSAELSIILKRLFPKVSTKRKRIQQGGGKETVFTGIRMLEDEAEEPKGVCTINDLKNFIPANILLLPCEEILKLCVSTDRVINGNIVLKIVKIYDKEWELWVRDCKVNLGKLGLDHSFNPSKASLLRILAIVDGILLCNGIPSDKMMHIEEKCYIKEKEREGTGDEIYVARSNYCKQVTTWKTITRVCSSCQRLVNKINKINRIIKEDIDNYNKVKPMWDQCFPNATEELNVLLQAQKDVQKSKKNVARRWDKHVISLCLSLSIQSPRNYRILRNSELLLLPCRRHLRRYKRAEKDVGSQSNVFHCISEYLRGLKVEKNEAQRMQITMENSKICENTKRLSSNVEANSDAPPSSSNSNEEKRKVPDETQKAKEKTKIEKVLKPPSSSKFEEGKIKVQGKTRKRKKKKEKVLKWPFRESGYNCTCTRQSSNVEVNSDTPPSSSNSNGGKRKVPDKTQKGKLKKQKMVKWPCRECGLNCKTNCVCCGKCDIWFHFKCVGLNGNEEHLAEEEWRCSHCQNNILSEDSDEFVVVT